MITIVDYGLGNIQAFTNIYKRLDIPVSVASTPDDLAKADKIILPGVGSFDWAMASLDNSGMRECLDDLVLNQGRPVVGICVGMQMMAKRSDEGTRPGLGWIEAEVKRFNSTDQDGKKILLPHMGWNDVTPLDTGDLFREVKDARFYFLHSYFFSPSNQEEILAITEYQGQRFASAVRSGAIYGVQFHPEKSHQWGISLLKNFAEL